MGALLTGFAACGGGDGAARAGDGAVTAEPDAALVERARGTHERVITLDVDVSWMVVYVGRGDLTEEGFDDAYAQAIEKFEAIQRLTEEIAPARIELALTSDDAAGRPPSLHAETVGSTGRLAANPPSAKPLLTADHVGTHGTLRYRTDVPWPVSRCLQRAS